jgi:ELWxxDGT repeat protein
VQHSAAVSDPIAVSDINLTGADSSPRSLVEVNGSLFFVAGDAEHGRELRRTDGARSGSVLVKDILPGPRGSEPNLLTDVRGTLFFAADDGIHGPELWKSDGTRRGTVLVKDIWPGPDSSFPNELTDVNGTLFFSALDPTSGTGAWKSDGTPAGTRRLHDTGFEGYISDFTNVAGALFFVAPGERGRELWTSDGTRSGTVYVTNVSFPNYSPYEIEEVRGTLFFTRRGNLWRIDRTGGASVLVKRGIRPENLAEVGNELFFTIEDNQNEQEGDELWKSDGTRRGTALVRNLPVYVSWGSLTDVDGRLFFVASFSSDEELWSSDGSRAGTRLVRAWPWPHQGGPGMLTNVNGTLFFTADDETHGMEVWRSDGTPEGTLMVADVFPGEDSGIPTSYRDNLFLSPPASVAGSLFFYAGDGTHGEELWATDGTPEGTSLVADIDTPRTRGSYPSLFTDVNGVVFFTADHGTGSVGLWRTESAEAGAVLVRSFELGPDFYEFNPGSFRPAELTNVGGTLLFAAYDEATGMELWRSDGTPSGTKLVKDVSPGASGSYPHELTEVDGLLFFWAAGGLWRSDGTNAGTVLVKELTTDQPQFTELASLSGALFFSISSCCGSELWRSDGTEAGTVLVTDVLVGPSDQLIDVNGMLFFSAGDELWKSDGTAMGTVSLAHGIYPTHLTDVDGSLFFSLNRSGRLDELWKSDGTKAGTVRVKDIPGRLLGQITDLVDVDGTAFLTLIRDRYEPTYRGWMELWKSDGTRKGTVFVRSWPRPDGSLPQDLTAVEGTLCFTASDGSTGLEPWTSDGTAAGTFLVSDIRPGRQGSKPTALSSASGLLFFAADEGMRGVEPWVLAP